VWQTSLQREQASSYSLFSRPPLRTSTFLFLSRSFGVFLTRRTFSSTPSLDDSCCPAPPSVPSVLVADSFSPPDVCGPLLSRLFPHQTASCDSAGPFFLADQQGFSSPPLPPFFCFGRQVCKVGDGPRRLFSSLEDEAEVPFPVLLIRPRLSSPEMRRYFGVDSRLPPFARKPPLSSECLLVALIEGTRLAGFPRRPPCEGPRPASSLPPPKTAFS